jgi:hypothetical protein
VTWNTSRHAVPGRERPIEPWSLRPERSVGRHVLDSPSPYSCLVPESPYLQGRAKGVRLSDVPCFVGIAVANAQLDIALRPSGTRWAVPNDASGVTTLVERLAALPPLIVLEATGGLERAATAALATAALPVVVVHPRQGRDGARATGQRAKTAA